MKYGFKTCGPNTAMVISGCFEANPKYIIGGSKFVIPLLQRCDKISLNTMTLTIQSEKICTQLGVPITVVGVAQVRISAKNREMFDLAVELFLGKDVDAIQKIVHQTMEGHQRSIIGTMTVEEIYKDRIKFSRAVFDVATTDLLNMGISVVSYTLKDVSDDKGYLSALGRNRTVQVKCDAKIGEAKASMESSISKATNSFKKSDAKYKNDIEIEKSKRNFKLKQAECEIEIKTNEAKSDFAYQLQESKSKQEIKDSEMQICLLAKTKNIEIQKLEIERVEKNLDATVRKPAEAEKFKLQKLSEAENKKIIFKAQAEAEEIQLIGEAQAFAIEAKAKATAEQMIKKAEAWKIYGDSAKFNLMLQAAPLIAGSIGKAVAKVNKVKLVCSGGKQSELGAAKIVGDVIDIIERMPKVLEGMTHHICFNKTISNDAGE